MKSLFTFLFLIVILNSQVKEIQTVKSSASESIIVDKDRLVVAIGNNGAIGDVEVLGSDLKYGYYDDKVFLYSGGFYLTGFSNDTLWGNGVFSSSRMNDFQPGNVGENPEDEKFKIYHIKQSDAHFGDSWLEWITAVELGANFYDGDGDNVYNPVDKNGNGKWDVDEDRPDLIGQETYWFVINDGVPKESRSRFSVEPQGIEIRVTIFTSGNGLSESFDNTIFFRYEIENRSQTENVLKDVYFSFAQDTDIGDYNDDLVGTYIEGKSGYVYNDGEDEDFGNAPASLIALLEGPVKYWKGKSFEDINNNNVYDEGIDTALDTAFVKSGEILGEVSFPGAVNLGLHSVMENTRHYFPTRIPDNQFELRNLQDGGHHASSGDSLFISSWTHGNGDMLGADSNLFPFKFMYWGDPETQNGWLDSTPQDQRMMVTTGKFDLHFGEPKTILGAMIVARGETSVKSVTMAKEFVNVIRESYNNNFTDIPVSISEENYNAPITFNLAQNYPNPFNPSTSIEYTVPSNEYVSLKVYDILGNEVALLVNEQKSAGNYEVKFNASNLSSGVYFYRLQTSSGVIMTKKLMLLK